MKVVEEEEEELKESKRRRTNERTKEDKEETVVERKKSLVLMEEEGDPSRGQRSRPLDPLQPLNLKTSPLPSDLRGRGLHAEMEAT